LSFTDYKTGRPIVEVTTPGIRADRLREAVENGSALQALAYALSEDMNSKGRYLHLRPDLDERLRVLNSDESEDLPEVFKRTVSTVLAAWDRGSFPPRLREVGEDKEPDACERCEVKEACLRGDSGVRGRLGSWMDATSAKNATGAEREAIRIWNLAGAKS
jgi:hypothetical protein